MLFLFGTSLAHHIIGPILQRLSHLLVVANAFNVFHMKEFAFTVCMIGTHPLANASRKKNGRVRLATNSPSLASAYFPVI